MVDSDINSYRLFYHLKMNLVVGVKLLIFILFKQI